MKKLLLSTIVLICFSLSAILFELSCHKESIAIPSTAQLNKIVYITGGQIGPSQLYIANYDGSSQTKINISIPGATNLGISNPRLSPDGIRVFFYATLNTSSQATPTGIYSTKIDGTDLKLVVNGASELGGAY